MNASEQTITKPKMSFLDRIKKHFTTTALVLIPICVGINLVVGWIVVTLKLPIYLDSIGTVLAGAMAGPWVAATVGLLTNVFLALIVNPIYLPYAVVSIALGLIVGFSAMKGWFRPWIPIIITWLCVALATITTATLISIFFFGGVPGATGSDFFTAALLAVGKDLLTAVLGPTIVIELIDKGIAILVAYLIVINLPKRFISQVTMASLKAKKQVDKPA